MKQRIRQPRPSQRPSQETGAAFALRPFSAPAQPGSAQAAAPDMQQSAARLAHTIADTPIQAATAARARKPQRQQAPPIQARLTVGQPNDPYEQEAERAAAQAVAQIPTPATRPASSQPPAGDALQRSPATQGGAPGPGPDSGDLAAGIAQARQGGQALGPQVQAQMGRALGADFSGVRVHTDVQSDQLSQSIQADAFTTGQDVFFRQGAYEPTSHSGQELIAHELAHVVQQQGLAQRGPVPPIRQRAGGRALISPGRGKQTTTKSGGAAPQVNQVDPAIAAKAQVILLEAEAVKKETTPARAQAILQELSQQQPLIAQMQRTQNQTSASQKIASALSTLGDVVAAKQSAETQAEASKKEAADIAKKQAALPTGLTKVRTSLSSVQSQLGAIIGAGTAGEVTTALQLVTAAKGDAIKVRGVMAGLATAWQQALATHTQGWGAINAAHLNQYVAQTFIDEHQQALSTIRVAIEAVEQANATVISLMPHVESIANHAKLVADAKLDMLAKNQEASTLEDEATKQSEAAKLAKDAAQKLEKLVKQATQEVQGAQALVAKAQEQVQSATQALEKAQVNRQSLAENTEAEPYILAAYTEDAEQDVATAQSSKTAADSGLASATQKQEQADSQLATTTQEHTLASTQAKDKQDKADLSTETAKLGRAEADTAQVTTGQRITEAQQGLATSQQEVAELDALRGMAGGQKQLNALAAHVPAPAEQRALMTAVGYQLLMDLLNANISKQRIGDLGAAFGADIASFATAVEHRHIISLLGSFTPAEVKALYDQPNIGAARLKDLVATCTAPTLKTYCDEMTVATLNDYLGAFTPSALHKLATDMTLPTLADLSTEFSATELRDFAAAITNAKLLDLTTVYDATAIKGLTTDYGNTKLKELLSGMTAAQMQAYITEIGKDRLIEVMDTHQLKVDALTHYGAAWLKDWSGADDATFDHLEDIKIKADGVVSGGHDLTTFCNFLDAVISPNGVAPVVHRGSYVPNNPGDGTKVTYTTFNPNGTQRATGSKTLINGLAGKRVAMLAAVNTAIWAAIRNKTFAQASGAWTAGVYQGFHDGSYVATFYP